MQIWLEILLVHRICADKKVPHQYSASKLSLSGEHFYVFEPYIIYVNAAILVIPPPQEDST